MGLLQQYQDAQLAFENRFVGICLSWGPLCCPASRLDVILASGYDSMQSDVMDICKTKLHKLRGQHVARRGLLINKKLHWLLIRETTGAC